MRRSLNRIWTVFLLLLVITQPACVFSKKATVGSVALLLQDIAKSSSRQTDLRVLREGMPAYLMLMDGMVEAWPDNEMLLLGAAQGYSSFASVFVGDQDKGYAKVLYKRSMDYAVRALEKRGLKDPVQRSFDSFVEGLMGLTKDDVPYIFWTATCWGSWISLNLDSMEALAELPRVELMMRRVLELDEGFYYGGAHLFMGIWFVSRPTIAGGDLQKAQRHFVKALELGQGKFLMAYVYYADHYARRALDKDLFVSTLKTVLNTPADIVPELTLLNTIAKEKAQEFLDRVDEDFE